MMTSKQSDIIPASIEERIELFRAVLSFQPEKTRDSNGNYTIVKPGTLRTMISTGDRYITLSAIDTYLLWKALNENIEKIRALAKFEKEQKLADL